jgi:hypothetical protein
MNAAVDHAFRELDELVLHLKGLVLVHKVREQRGADDSELAMFRAEIERTRERLANLVAGGALHEAAA